MRRMIVIVLALLLLVGCASVPAEPSDPVVPTTAPSMATDPATVPTDPVPTEPPATQPSVTEPDPTEPELPTLPDVGEDPGGFGPIF